MSGRQSGPEYREAALANVTRLVRSAIAAYVQHWKGWKLHWFWRLVASLMGTLTLTVMALGWTESNWLDLGSSSETSENDQSKDSASLLSQVATGLEIGPAMLIGALTTPAVTLAVVIMASLRRGSPLHFFVLGFVLSALLLWVAKFATG